MKNIYLIAINTMVCFALFACSSSNTTTDAVTATNEKVLGEETGVFDDAGNAILYFPDANRYMFDQTLFDANSAIITNPYLMLGVGRQTEFEGETEDAFERIVLEVLPETRNVNGVESAIVLDTVYHDGQVVEKTFDWFAQDTLGRVWYMGEEVQDFENGVLISTSGSWEAGKDILDIGFVAEAGIQMFAVPEVGTPYHQEYYETEAVDAAQITDLAAEIVLSDGTVHTAIEVLEWVPLEPTEFAYKYYAENVGLILETNMDGGERIELISITD